MTLAYIEFMALVVAILAAGTGLSALLSLYEWYCVTTLSRGPVGFPAAPRHGDSYLDYDGSLYSYDSSKGAWEIIDTETTP